MMAPLPHPATTAPEAILLQLIQQAAPVQTIYILGQAHTQLHTSGIFLPGGGSTRQPVHYWLLVLFDAATGLTANLVQEKIENACRRYLPVTAMVFTGGRFSSWLATGRRFACTVIQQAPLLYSHTGMPLTTAATPQAAEPCGQSRYTQGLNTVNECIAGAALYQLRRQNKMAACMLQQATVKALHTLLLQATGLHFATPNINKLLRYAALVNSTIAAHILNPGQPGTSWHQLLQQAHINTANPMAYTITTAQLQQLTQKVKALQQLLHGHTAAL